MAIEKLQQAQQFGRQITAMVTPFDSENVMAIDTAGTIRLARHLVRNRTTCIVVSGTTGESPTLEEEEHEMARLEATLLETVGDHIPVIVGTSTNNTAKSVRLSRQAQTEGAHGLLLVTPYYNKPSQEGLKRHFGAIAEGTQGEIPLILYNVPSRTNVNIAPETVWWLAEHYPSIVGLKEARGLAEPKDKAHVDRILDERPIDFTVWSGNDADTYYFLEHGGYGVVSVASHIVGRQIDEMINLFLQGRIEEARVKDQHLQPLAQALFPPESPEPSPSAIKACLNIVGIPVGGVRLPLVDVSDDYKEVLKTILSTQQLDPISQPIRA